MCLSDLCVQYYTSTDQPISWLFLRVGHELVMVGHKLAMIGQMPTLGYPSVSNIAYRHQVYVRSAKGA